MQRFHFQLRESLPPSTIAWLLHEVWQLAVLYIETNFPWTRKMMGRKLVVDNLPDSCSRKNKDVFTYSRLYEAICQQFSNLIWLVFRTCVCLFSRTSVGSVSNVTVDEFRNGEPTCLDFWKMISQYRRMFNGSLLGYWLSLLELKNITNKD